MLDKNNTDYIDYKRLDYNGGGAFEGCRYFAAFSNEQFREGIESIDLADGEKVVNLGYGVFIAKGDVDKFRRNCELRDKGLKRIMSDPSAAYGAFLYEIGNHEYLINYQAEWDVFSCFGNVEYAYDKTADDYMDDLGYSDEVKAAFHEALRDHIREADEKGWY